MPEQWFACYVGTFPGRQAAGGPSWVRVECIVGDELQRSYAGDVSVLREHLACLGMTWLGDDELRAIEWLARSPFPLELQFDVGPQGEVLPVLSASVRFVSQDWADPERRQRIIDLLQEVRNRGLADDRLEQLAGTVVSKHIVRGDESINLLCIPAFVKLRWRAGEPPCAKTYLMVKAG